MTVEQLHGLLGQFSPITILNSTGAQYVNVVFVQQYSSWLTPVQGQGTLGISRVGFADWQSSTN